MKDKLESSCINTDKEIWRKVKDDYYSPSIHVTEEGNIGINVYGQVIVMPIEDWFYLARERTTFPKTTIQKEEYKKLWLLSFSSIVFFVMVILIGCHFIFN